MNNKYEEIPVSELPPEDVSTGFSDLVFLIHEGGNCMGYYDFNLNAWMARIRSSPIRVTPTAWMRKLPPTEALSQSGILDFLRSHPATSEWLTYCEKNYTMDVPMMVVAAIQKLQSLSTEKLDVSVDRDGNDEMEIVTPPVDRTVLIPVYDEWPVKEGVYTIGRSEKHQDAYYAGNGKWKFYKGRSDDKDYKDVIYWFKEVPLKSLCENL